MTQYINLLDRSLLPRRDPISLPSLAIALAVVLALLGAAHAVSRFVAGGSDEQVALAEAQLRADQERLVATGRTQAAARPDARLVAEREAARAALQARESALATLAGGSLGSTTGFSEQLRAFSRQSMTGLWLTGFSLSGGDEILIQGRALRAEQVPGYLRRLKEEPVFRGRSFASLRVEEGFLEKASAAARPAIAAPFVEFRLTTRPDAASAPGGTDSGGKP